MGRREPDLREELLAARDKLNRQIELLENPTHPRAWDDNSALIAELVGVRREIDLRLDELG